MSRRSCLATLLLVIALAVSDSARAQTPGPPPSPSPGSAAPLLLGNQPFFPIGVAGAPFDLLGSSAQSGPDFDRLFGALSGAGMNVFYPFFLTSETANTSSDAVLDFIPDDCLVRRQNPKGGIASLARSGLAVLFPAFVAIEKTSDLLRDRSLDEAFARQRLQTVMRCYAGVPIFAFQSYDDAPVYKGEGVSLQKIRQLKTLVTSLRQGATPYVLLIHPTEESLAYVPQQELKTFLAAKLRANLPSYSSAELADGIGLYIYPVPFAAPESVGPAIDRSRALQPTPLRPLVVLQGLGMADAKLNPVARRPTNRETRFMAFQAIVFGAGGVLWYGANFVPSSSELWQSITRTASEIRKISPWLIGPNSPILPHVPGLQVLLKDPVAGRTRHLLIAVNPRPTSQRVEFSVASPKVYRTVREYLEQRTITPTNGRFTDTFPAYGVHVYEVKFGDAK